MNRRGFLGAFAMGAGSLLVPRSALSDDRSIAVVPNMESAEAYAKALPTLEVMQPHHEDLIAAGRVEDLGEVPNLDIRHGVWDDRKPKDTFSVERVVNRDGVSTGKLFGIDAAGAILEAAVSKGLFPIESHHRGQVLKGLVFACSEREFSGLVAA